MHKNDERYSSLTTSLGKTQLHWVRNLPGDVVKEENLSSFYIIRLTTLDVHCTYVLAIMHNWQFLIIECTICVIAALASETSLNKMQ